MRGVTTVLAEITRTPKFAISGHRCLAAAYAANGQFAEAVECHPLRGGQAEDVETIAGDQANLAMFHTAARRRIEVRPLFAIRRDRGEDTYEPIVKASRVAALFAQQIVLDERPAAFFV